MGIYQSRDQYNFNGGPVMKWVLILLIFHGNGAPAVVREEFSMLSDCMAAQRMLQIATPNAVAVGGCTQKM
mgnify:CR=1 FL=1